VSASRIYRASSPYFGSELGDVDWEQSADTMYLAHLNHAPTKLTRAGHTDWSFSTITFAPTVATPASVAATATTPNTDSANSGAAYFPQVSRYVVTAMDDDTGRESRPSAIASATNSLNLARNYNTITWAAVTGAERYRVYKSIVTGDFGYIGTTDQLSFTDDNIGPDLSDGPPQSYNPFPTSNDYPSTVTFFQQRLGWARSNNHPNAMWFSRPGEYENMDISRPLKASDSLTFALVAGKVNAVNQLVPMNELLALTSDSVFAVSGGQQGYLSPTNIVTQRQTGRGSSRLNPLVVDNVSFYQVGVGCAIRTLGYEFSIDGYNSNDVTIFSPHLFRGYTIVSWAYSAEPLSVIWAVRSDGILLAFTWQQEQQVWGWTLCETDGKVESVCTISEGGEDRLYLTVRRTINGVSRLFIERMAASRWEDVAQTCFMDAAVTYQFATPQTVLRNLDHLEGKDVVALADGAVVTGLTVAGGIVTLDDPASYVTVGLPFTSTIETLPLATQTQAGWTLAKPQQVNKVSLRVKDSRGILAGPSDDKLVEMKPRSNEPFGSPPKLQTGVVEAIMPPMIRSGDRGDAGVTITVQSPHPLPLTLTAVLYDPAVSQ
jgi:hypothetical protein